MKSNYRRIGDYIREVKVRNYDLKVQKLLGINIDKYFMPSVANVVGTDMSVYKIVKKNQFACNRMHVGRDYRLPISMSISDDEFLVSPAYDVFEIIDSSLLNEFLMLWFMRPEFDRNAWFYTDEDVRGGLSWKSFCDMELPVPSIEKQREIVAEYNAIQRRIELNEQLIQKLEDTAQTIYKRWFVEFEFPNENGLPYKSNGGEMVWNEELSKEIPKGWEVKSLGEIADINMGQSPEGETYNSEKNGIIFYQGRTDFGKRFPLISTYTTSPKKIANKNDILISVRAPVGDINIATLNCAIGRGLASLNSKLKCNSFLFYTLQLLKNEFDITDKEGTIFGSITKDNLYNMKTLYSEVLILNIERILFKIDETIKCKSFQNQKISELKNLLLSKLATVEG